MFSIDKVRANPSIKPLPGMDERYFAGWDGKIYSCVGWRGAKKSYISELRPTVFSNGYLFLNLTCRGKNFVQPVHYWITLVFFGERLPGFCVNHKNGVKTNNHISNLEYVTYARNLEHAREMGLNKGTHGKDVWTSKLTEEQVLEIRRDFPYVQGKRLQHGELKKLCEKYGISNVSMSKVIQGKSWKHLLES